MNSGSFLCLLVLAFVLGPFTGICGSDKDQSRTQLKGADSFSAMVNDVAIPKRLLIGIKEGDDKCKVRLTRPDPAKAEEGLERIYRELLRSPLRREIAQFNRPLMPAHKDTFSLDKETCAIKSYQGRWSPFKSPLEKQASGFTLRYATPPVKYQVLEVRLPGQAPYQITEGSEDYSNVDLKKSEGTLGRKGVTFFWGDKPVIEWYRHSSILRPKSDDIFVRLYRSDGAAKELIPKDDDTVFFEPGTVMTLYKKSGSSAMKDNLLATITLPASTSGEAIYRKVKGKFSWTRRPTNFEVQVVNALRASNRPIRGEITLTPHPDLSSELQSALDGAAKKLRVATTTGAPPIYGSIAMLDAKSGEVVGVAGYPVSPSPQRLASGDFEPGDAREEFLKRRVIGSAAKVPVGYAVLMANPFLRTFKLPLEPYKEAEGNDGYITFDSIMGVKIKSLNESHIPSDCGNWVDFSCFIVESSNRYATMLLSAAAVKDGNSVETFLRDSKPLGRDYFAVGSGSGSVITKQPASFLFGGNGSPSTTAITNLPWVKTAGDIFGIKPEFSSWEVDNFDTYLWRHALKDKAEKQVQAFQPVSPETVNFRLNRYADFRNDYLTLILGGGESRWSAIKLAESYARVVRKKMVQATFVKPEKSEVFPDLPVPDLAERREAHEALLRGMEKVIDSRGTASWLTDEKKKLVSQAYSRGYRLKLYAKTGTPTVQSKSSSQMRDRFKQLYYDEVITSTGRYDTPQGYRFYFNSNLITTDMVKKLPRHMQFSSLQEQKAVLGYFAARNKEEGKDQKVMFEIKGQDFKCKAGCDTGMARRDSSEYEGKNLVVLAQLFCGDEERNSAVVSFGLSFQPDDDKDDKGFLKMVKTVMGENGAFARYLGLTDQNKRCNHEN